MAFGRCRGGFELAGAALPLGDQRELAWPHEGRRKSRASCPLQRSLEGRDTLILAHVSRPREAVLSWSCVKVLAVTVPLECGRVAMTQFANHAVNVDFPMP